MAKVKLEVRQSNVIYQAAVGSVIHIGGHSLVPSDTRYWEEHGEKIEMRRLTRAMGGRTFRKAPVIEQRGPISIGGRVPVVRFPGWMYCPMCRRMYGYPRSDGHAADAIICQEEACKKAESVLAPMPWMMICRNGHMDDLPWRYIVHRDKNTLPAQRTCADRTRLFFRPADAKNRRSRVVCGACKATLDLRSLDGKLFLTGVQCRGKQPWLRDEEECDAQADNGGLVVAGLGDHNVHFPVVVSALDIPPESRLDPRNDTGGLLRQHPDWRLLETLHERHGAGNAVVVNKVRTIAQSIGVEPTAVWLLLQPEPEKIADKPDTETPLAQSHLVRAEEYEAFLAQVTDYREYERFITVPRTDEWREYLEDGSLHPRARKIGQLISNLVGAPRLREIRALDGFTRVDPIGTPDVRMVPADFVGVSSWLPAAELFGEGFFFVLDGEALQRWNRGAAVMKRTEIVRQRYEASTFKNILNISEEALPQFIAIHTLTHLIIREMAFECGYPSASLRERLFVSEGEAGMTGALIYLAAGEPGGSLGGLAELSEPKRFLGLLLRAIETAQWCALDPVCGEHEGRGDPPLNRAACHACCLLPETSCECGNLLLDRTLIASADEADMTGFFDTD
jgi:hypothetical protein